MFTPCQHYARCGDKANCVCVCVCVCARARARILSIMLMFSHVGLFATPWTAAHQAPLPTGFPRQGYWSGLPFLHPGDLPDPGIEPASPVLQADSLALAT